MKAGQAAAEGEWTRQTMGVGHVFMATLTLRDDALSFTAPRAVDLATEVFPPLREKHVTDFALRQFCRDTYSRQAWFTCAKVHQEYRKDAQERMLGHRWGFKSEQFEQLATGAMDPVPTLSYRQVELYFKRLRKAGMSFRYFCASEYGSQGDRPHYHVLFYGLNGDQFEQALRMWPHGYTDPNPATVKGQRLIEWQIQKNANPAAAANYAAKYLAKGYDVPRNASEALREQERTRSSRSPGLGHEYAKDYLVPILNRIWHGELPNRMASCIAGADGVVFRTSNGERGYATVPEWLKTQLVLDACGHFMVGTDKFPTTYYLREKILADTDVPQDTVLAVRAFQAQLKQDEARERAADPAREAEYQQELDDRKTEHEQREKARAEKARRKSRQGKRGFKAGSPQRQRHASSGRASAEL